MDADDFDDFGGFEEAEPVAPSIASQSSLMFTSGNSSHWSFLNNQPTTQPPDLLNPQDTFPLCLETPGGHDLVARGAHAVVYTEREEYPGSGLVGANSIADNMDHGDVEAAGEQCHRAESELVDRILDGTLGSRDQLRATNPSHDLSQPDLSTNSINLPNICLNTVPVKPETDDSWFDRDTNSDESVSPSDGNDQRHRLSNHDDTMIQQQQQRGGVGDVGADVKVIPDVFKDLGSDKSGENGRIEKPNTNNNCAMLTDDGGKNDAQRDDVVCDKTDQQDAQSTAKLNERCDSVVDGRKTRRDSEEKGHTELKKTEHAQSGKTKSVANVNKSVVNGDWSMKELDDLDWLVDDVAEGDFAGKHVSDKAPGLQNYPKQPDVAQRDLQTKFEKEVEEMRRRNDELEEVLVDCQEELRTQKHKCSLLQEKHATELSNIRKAGHDAIAVLMEQNQASTKLALLQQEESFQKELHKTISQMHVEAHEASTHQKEELLLLLHEEQHKQRELWEQRMDERLSLMKSDSAKDVTDQRLKQQKLLTQTIEEERTKSVEVMEKATREERALCDELLAAERGEFERLRREEGRSCEERITSALSAAALEHKRLLVEAVEAERMRQRETHTTAVGVARAEVKAYLDDQVQESRSLHARQLSGLDLFLESARRQLDLIMSPDQPSPS